MGEFRSNAVVCITQMSAVSVDEPAQLAQLTRRRD